MRNSLFKEQPKSKHGFRLFGAPIPPFFQGAHEKSPKYPEWHLGDVGEFCKAPSLLDLRLRRGGGFLFFSPGCAPVEQQHAARHHQADDVGNGFRHNQAEGAGGQHPDEAAMTETHSMLDRSDETVCVRTLRTVGTP